MKRKIKLILWDFGGVLTESPIKKFKEFEKNNKIPIGTIVNINSNNKYDNAWAKLEKNLINKKQFSKLFLKEAKNLNIEEELNIDEILACLNVDLNEEMVSFFLKLKDKIPCACLTNNISENVSKDAGDTFLNFKRNFIQVFESCKIGMRKPEKKIYEYVARQLSVKPENILFLDDLGVNLKIAKSVGFITHKVEKTDDTITYLKKMLNI